MADDPIWLCLLDCSSIQQYVFGSNKLKTNVGASHVVEQLYTYWIPETLAQLFPDESKQDIQSRFDRWRAEPYINQLELESSSKTNWETGYVGGGNALMLFRSEQQAKSFIYQWSRNVLQHAPGIHPVVACIPATVSTLPQRINDVFKELNQNKSLYIPHTTLPRHGITAEDRLSGLSQDVFHFFQEANTRRAVSSVIKTKLNHFEPANKTMERRYRDVLKDEYEFAIDIENMGQTKGYENHVAIVHIDGNNMGDYFKACRTLFDRRRLSVRVNEIVHAAMGKSLQALISKMDALIQENVLNFPNNSQKQNTAISKKKKKQRLPLRPIILNGDDVTFICDARVALFLTEHYLRAFAEERVPTSERHFSACAGISILRTKYPFYRGYRLAEDLCQEAKKLGRANNTSWIDFHISYRGLGSSLRAIRSQYETEKTSLLWRPWQVDESDSERSFAMLKKAIYQFKYADNPWPKNKIHELVRELEKSKYEPKLIKGFLAHLKLRELSLPQIGSIQTHTNGWCSINGMQKPPYFDIVELMDFYPECLLK